MLYDHAKYYLARVLHWPDANEEPAFTNIHWTFKKPEEDKTIWTGRACKSVKEAISAIDFALNKSKGTLDVYACLSTQKTATEKVSARGFKYFTPIRNQGNAVKLKCLFLDIDLKGGDHGYNSAPEAAGALGEFLKLTNMPKPTMIVASGGGFHVYWTLMRALTPIEWSPLAIALAEATKKHNLKCDTQCTVDSARVLRIPDTLNRKQAVARLVSFIGTPLDFDYSNERIEKALAPYKNATITPLALPILAPLAGVSDLAAGITIHAAEPIKLKPLAMECAFIRDAVLSGGASLTNPHWNVTTLLSTFLENGRSAAHLMAKGHAGYSQSSTDELFDRKEREKATKNLGWPSCQTISAYGCKSCQLCQHFGKGKSPLNFARPLASPAMPAVQLPPADQADMPKGYRRMPNGKVAKQIVNAEGITEEYAVCNYPMTDAQLELNMGKLVLHFMTEKGGQKMKIQIPAGSIGGMDMRRILQDQGLILPYKMEVAKDFMGSWVETLQETRSAVNLVTFGWNLDKAQKVEGFVYADQLWTPTGPKMAATRSSRISQHYHPKGDIKHWQAAVKIITDQHRPQLDAMICASFAAPLVRFIGLKGLILSAYSTMSGKGKTTSMDIAQAVWGSPVQKLGVSDTANRAGGVMADLHSLPLIWDEIKSEEQLRAITNLIYQVCDSGREKGRMNADTSLRYSGEFQSLMLVASNDSILEWADKNMGLTDATFLRIFEWEVTDPSTLGQLDPGYVQRATAELRDHYGNMGVEYAKYLGVNHVAIRKEVGDYHTALNERLKIANEERFWSSSMAVLLVAAKIMNEQGYAAVDMPLLEAFLINTLSSLRLSRKARPGDIKQTLNAVELMEGYLSSQRSRHTLMTNIVNQGTGRPAPGSIKVLNDNSSRLEEIHVQVGRDDKIVRIHNAHFRHWLSEQGYGPNKTLKELDAKFGVRDVVGSLGSGTFYATSKIKLKEIDLSGAGIALDFIDV